MEEMTLRVPVAVKAKVTEDLKAKIVSDLETRLDMVNKDLEAIEFQAQRILADAAKVDATSLTAIRQQIDEEKKMCIRDRCHVSCLNKGYKIVIIRCVHKIPL